MELEKKIVTSKNPKDYTVFIRFYTNDEKNSKKKKMEGRESQTYE
jgi:hypothetical protein